MNTLKTLIIVMLFMACGKSKADQSANTPAPPADSSHAPGTVLTVMTYNIHHGNPPESGEDVRDMQGIADIINAQKPDLVSLNEVDVNNTRSGKSLDEAHELGRLTGMYVYFAAALNYEGGYYGDAVLSRYPILDSMRYPLPYVLPGSETRDVAMITIDVNGEKILFASTHLDHLTPEDNRIRQAEIIADSIIPQLKYPLIFAGDLNASPDSKTISILEKRMTAACSGSGCPLTFPYNKPTATLDYIMCRPADRLSFLSYKAPNGINVSDHLPLAAKIKLEKE